VRDYALCLSLIFLIGSGISQILLLLLLISGTTVFQAKNFIYVNKSTNVLNVINQTGYILILLIFFLLHVSGNNISLETRFSVFGNLLIIIVLSMMLINVLVALVCTLKELKERCRKKNSRGKIAAKPTLNRTVIANNLNQSVRSSLFE
jgi:hypothetical protein